MPYNKDAEIYDLMGKAMMKQMQRLQGADFCKLSSQFAQLSGPKCKNCDVPVTGHIADAGLVIDYAGYKFCSDTCVENWVDEMQG